jgi:predicted nucleotidyltransferase
MNAEPLLSKVAKVLAEHRLEAVMVGNAAAALQGAPVTTLDIDFMFRKTPRNLKKLKAVASSLGADILKPYYPVSDLFRVVNDDQGLQIDFMARLHGVRSFEGLRARAKTISFGGHTLLIAALADIIKSKRAAGRPRDKAVLDILEKTLEQQTDDKEGA